MRAPRPDPAMPAPVSGPMSGPVSGSPPDSGSGLRPEYRSDEERLRAILARCGSSTSDGDLDPVAAPGARLSLRPAAVLVPVWPGPGGARVVLTKRSARLRDHPGQVALPGGGIERADPSPEAAALRESHEEIGLDPASVRVLGRLATHVTVTGFSVTPVLGLIEGPFSPLPDASEVEEVFAPPLEHLLDPAHYAVERRRWHGVWRHYYTIPWGPYYIWGATARILRSMAGAAG